MACGYIGDSLGVQIVGDDVFVTLKIAYSEVLNRCG